MLAFRREEMGDCRPELQGWENRRMQAGTGTEVKHTQYHPKHKFTLKGQPKKNKVFNEQLEN